MRIITILILLLNNPILSIINAVYFAGVMFKLFNGDRLKRCERYWTGILLFLNIIDFIAETYNYFA